MNVKNFVCLVSLFSLVFSCKENSSKITVENSRRAEKKSIIEDTVEKPIYDLIRKAIAKGDTVAYSNVSSIYFHEENETEFLYVAMIMANKYDYSAAYYDVYTTFAYPYTGERLDAMDHDTKCLALYYLLRAKEKGVDQAINECETIFKGKKIPKSSFFLLEMAKD